LLLAFYVFTAFGTAWLYTAITQDSPLPWVLIAMLALAGVFRWLRLDLSRNTPLEFEDELPESTYGLRLNS